MPGSINIAGLASNIDWNATVDKLIEVEKQEVTLLEQRQSDLVTRQDAYAQLNSALLDLRNIAVDMADADRFFSYQASLSSNTSVAADSLVQATVSSSAASGSHTLIVSQLAQAMKVTSSAPVQDSTATAITSASSALNLSGSFTVNGQTVTIDASHSLNDVALAINQLDAGVQASVIKAADADYRLVLTAEETGAAGFTLAGADLSGSLAGLGLSGGGTVQQAGQDAQITLDGISMSRSSNVIDDALAGVSLTLTRADPATTVTLNISQDTAALKEKVQSFVDAYNTISGFINEQMTFDEASGVGGALAGDSVLNMVQSRLNGRLMESIPGLASDRNNMVLIGVEPDEKGMLSINGSIFDEWLKNDPTAIRDVFAATAQGDAGLQFLTYGSNTVSGTYTVDITQAAAPAEVTGSTDLSGGLGADETVTFTTGSGRQAVLNLSAGTSLAQIVSQLNNEFDTVYTEQWRLGTALSAGGSPASSATSFADLGLGVSAGDSISISGTNRAGSSVNATFTILDPASDTLADLLAEIQSAFGQQVVASVNASGQIEITDTTPGDSSLTVSLTANNEGGGTLDFGTAAVVTEGRYSMGLKAEASGGFLKISSTGYGGSISFSISQSANNLGITDGSFSGQDVAGSIGGEPATGAGRRLTGTSGNVEGLSILYSGSATGNVGSISVSLGLGAILDGFIDTFANPVTGLIQNSIQAAQQDYDSLGDQITRLNEQIDRDRVRLLSAFQSMESALSTFNATGQWLTQQINSLNSGS